MKNISLLIVSSVLVSGCSALPETEPDVEIDPGRILWQTELSREDLVNKSVNDFERFASSNEEYPREINLYLDDRLSENRQSLVADLAELSVNSFGSYSQELTEIIVGKYPDFMVSVISENNLPHQGNFQICGNDLPTQHVSGCAVGNALWFGFGDQSDDYASMYAIVPHEIFHTVQHGLNKNLERGDSDIPAWFIEGSADFFGYAVLNRSGVAEYEIFMGDYWYYLPDPDNGLEFYSERSVGNIPPEYYWMGQIATEYLVSQIGAESVLNILKLTGSGESFENAFEESSGVTLKNFYEYFDKMYVYLFNQNKTAKTFLNRQCPEEWFCGDAASGEWWQLVGATYPLPDVPENSAHNLPVAADRIDPPFASCKLIPNEFQEGVAASHLALEETGASVPVSTQWYAQHNHLDKNLDGILCWTGD